MAQVPPAVVAAEDFAGGGEVARLMRTFDWTATPLGPPGRWPRALHSVLRVMLSSRYAMWLGWGPELAFFYNDTYARETLVQKHPWALGRPASEVWAEIWGDLETRIHQVLTSGEATYDEGLRLFLERRGFLEETYHTFSYSPLFDDEGAIAGMFCVVVEETERVIGERRLAALGRLAAELGEAQTEAQLSATLGVCLDAMGEDMPFSTVYVYDGDGVGRLMATGGFKGPHAMTPGQAHGPNALALFRENRSRLIDLATVPQAKDLPLGAWDRPATRALMVPLARQGQDAPAGFIVAALNPYRPLDETYERFLSLVAGQIASAWANVRAYQEERRRAEALAEIDAAKTAFFSNISHEFRTPLTLTLGPLEEILNAPAEIGDEPRALVATAHRNGLRLLKLVNTLLDFSRIEAGRLRATFRPLDLATYSRELASTFSSAMEKAGLDYEIDVAPLDEPVWVDPDLWEKIVLNLLSNAFKFTLEGGVKVRLGKAADAHAVALVVADTGVGIAAEELPRLFERFHRVEGAGGRSFEGSGIGLALVQELVQLHGGEIRVESEPGRGSRFIITLPLGTQHLPADRLDHGAVAQGATGRAEAFVEEALRWTPGPELETEIVGDTTPAAEPILIDGRSARVLLADDNADMRAYVGRLLERRGYEVTTAADGDQAWSAIGRSAPDLVLSDVMMPKVDGFELLRRVRADPALEATPVILLSARAGEEAKVEGLDAGADDYLVKPFAARELLARVDVNLRLAARRREADLTLRRLNEGLEARVEARTRELAAANRELLGQISERERVEEVLRMSQRLEAVGQLTSGVAHDFNNLLTVVLGNLTFLERRLSDPADLRRLGMMRAAAQRGASLTSQLLAFSRRQRLTPKSIDLNQAVSAMHDLLQSSLGGAVDVETDLGPDLWSARVDPTQLELVVLNLAINARDAMPQGGVVTIRTTNVQLGEGAWLEAPPAGDYVMVAVSDTGSGMRPEVLAKAFEPFFTTKEVGRGSGLGLAQVYGFAKQSGGGVVIDTAPGEGTTVKVFLPRAAGDDTAAAPGATRDARPRPAVSGRILVVDDDEAVREVTVAVVRGAGFEVVEAGSGGAALDHLANNPDVALMLLDFAMPGMNGDAVAREALQRRHDLPIIFLTGYADTAALSREGEAIVLQKPVAEEDLLDAVERALASAAATGGELTSRE